MIGLALLLVFSFLFLTCLPRACMLPEVAWIVAKHGKNERGDFALDKTYSHVKTVVIMEA